MTFEQLNARIWESVVLAVRGCCGTPNDAVIAPCVQGIEKLVCGNIGALQEQVAYESLRRTLLTRGPERI